MLAHADLCWPYVRARVCVRVWIATGRGHSRRVHRGPLLRLFLVRASLVTILLSCCPRPWCCVHHTPVSLVTMPVVTMRAVAAEWSDFYLH